MLLGVVFFSRSSISYQRKRTIANEALRSLSRGCFASANSTLTIRFFRDMVSVHIADLFERQASLHNNDERQVYGVERFFIRFISRYLGSWNDTGIFNAKETGSKKIESPTITSKVKIVVEEKCLCGSRRKRERGPFLFDYTLRNILDSPTM